MAASKTSLEAIIWWWIAFGGLLVLLGGFAIVGYQCWLWLKYGHWTPFEFWATWTQLGFPYPNTPNFQGVQKIIDWVMECPLSVVTMVIGAGIGFTGSLCASAAETAEIARQMAKAKPRR